MPILTSGSVVNRRTFRLEGLPDFNADSSYVISEFTGLRGRAAPDALLIDNGGGAGSVAIGRWLGKERLHQVSGLIHCGSYGEMVPVERALLNAIGVDRESSIQVLDPYADDLQMFVRLYDEPTITFADLYVRFSLPLVCPEGVKYALTPLTGDLGVFTGQSWFRDYTLSGTKWVRSYALTGSRWTRTYRQAVASGPYPPSVTLDSPGDATSRRVTVTITGPLTAGDWWLRNESTGEEMWVEVGVQAGQQLVIDMRSRTAYLDGSQVDHLVYGDWLSLAPGANLFRLASGTASAAFASVTALPAYL